MIPTNGLAAARRRSGAHPIDGAARRTIARPFGEIVIAMGTNWFQEGNKYLMNHGGLISEAETVAVNHVLKLLAQAGADGMAQAMQLLLNETIKLSHPRWHSELKKS